MVCVAVFCFFFSVFFFQAEDGIRDLVRSRGLGDVYKRQVQDSIDYIEIETTILKSQISSFETLLTGEFSSVEQTTAAYKLDMKQEKKNLLDARRFVIRGCLLYTSDAADDLLCVDLGGRRIIKKKTKKKKNKNNPF